MSVASAVAKSVVGQVASPVAGTSDGGAAAWSPLQLTGLEYWFDASDEATITHLAGAVSEWQDKSGNNRHISNAGSGNDLPTTGAATINGLNAIRFLGQYLQNLVRPAETPIIPQPFHVFMVVNFLVNPDGSRLIGGQSATEYSMIWPNTNWSLYSGSAGATNVLSNSTGLFFLGGLFNGASSQMKVNASAAQTVNPGTNGLTGLRVNGAHDGSGYHPSADYGEVFVCSGDKSSNLNEIVDYFSAKWGITA